MNNKVLKTLEFNKIINKLTAIAGSQPGKELCRALKPSISFDEIITSQNETSDALSMIFKNGSISFSGVKDIRPSLMRLDVGSILSMEELLDISRLLDVTLKVKSYTRKESPSQRPSTETNFEEPEQTNSSLTIYFSVLEPLSNLNNEIKRCIPAPGEISDDASSTLKQIRRSIKNSNSKIHEQLNNLVNSCRIMLQDSLITMRNDRYCLPVKAEYRSQFNGMIHDQSATGSTLFMEPMSVVKLNNELRELALKEQNEIERILAELSNESSTYIEELKINLETLTKLDFIFAKAGLSRQMKASAPIFNKNGIINIRKGRHPLLEPHSAVPIDIRLGTDFNLLVVTGPNTGGKTVSLKTVGLFTLMGQAGLHIPAFDKSQLGVFENIFADIGDEQSIEQSLSTFSSHMTNVISIIDQADEHSLCLFDELGAGTDPIEGAALAMSILSFLHNTGSKTMATTHYSELKLFALSTPGVENACCEFDVETLRPTYRLLIGIPGKSNAFAISGKLGLPSFIIDDAKKRIDHDNQNFEDVLADLEANRITIEKEQAELNAYKQEINELKQKLTIKNEKLDTAKEKILREANENAREILQNAKDYADESIRKYNKWAKETTFQKEMEKERTALREKLGKSESKLIRKTTKNKKNKPQDFKPGESVRVLSLNVTGTVLGKPNNKGNVYIQMGIMRSQFNIQDLELIDAPTPVTKKSTNTGSGKIKMSKGLSIRPEINIIGKTVDEGVSILDKYLDDACLSHLKQVTIIHGRGTGALRKGVHEYLKKSKYVKSYRSGEFGEGDIGVTIVEL